MGCSWSLVLRAAALLHLLRLCLRPALAHPTPPYPRHQTPQLSSPSFFSPPCLTPPVSSGLFFCILSSLAAPLASCLLRGRRGGGEHAAPWARAARREAYFPLLLGNLERVCVCARARVSCRRKRVGSSGEPRVRVFDVSRPLHKPRGARKSVSESAACTRAGCPWHTRWPGAPGPAVPSVGRGLP